jgi:predicted metalloprotease with PDZ domain
MHVDQLSGKGADFKMPVWIPGSYMIREFERHVERFQAWDAEGHKLPWRKVSKNTWRVDRSGSQSLRVRYWVYAFDRSIRGSYVDGEFAFINPSSVVMFVAGQLHRPYRLRLELPAGWTRVSTGLASEQDDPLSFLAADYDELVDCPLLAGNHAVTCFSVDSVDHEIAVAGRGPFDLDTLSCRLRPLIREAKSLFGEFPYRRFAFLVWLSETGGGGLEHRNSCALMVERFSLDPKQGVGSFVSLATHELFHAWNGKAIRPAPLGPFDYDRENYTTMLWFTEGFTTYYSGQLQLRAGVTTPESYLRSLANQISAYEASPGRAVQTLEQASFDAWIKYYRQDENFINSGRSYYSDGALFATVLDLEILHRTDGRFGLDEVMRALYRDYAKKGRWVTLDDFVRTCNRVARCDLSSLFRHVQSTEPMDLGQALEHAGLVISVSEKESKRAGYLGASIRGEGDRAFVGSVRRDSPAYRAGLYAGDELLAVNGYRVTASDAQRILSRYGPEDTLHLLVATSALIREVQVVLGEEPQRSLEIRRVENPTDLQKAIYEKWLHSPWPEETKSP